MFKLFFSVAVCENLMYKFFFLPLNEFVLEYMILKYPWNGLSLSYPLVVVMVVVSVFDVELFALTLAMLLPLFIATNEPVLLPPVLFNIFLYRVPHPYSRYGKSTHLFLEFTYNTL